MSKVVISTAAGTGMTGTELDGDSAGVVPSGDGNVRAGTPPDHVGDGQRGRTGPAGGCGDGVTELAQKELEKQGNQIRVDGPVQAGRTRLPGCSAAPRFHGPSAPFPRLRSLMPIASAMDKRPGRVARCGRAAGAFPASIFTFTRRGFPLWRQVRR